MIGSTRKQVFANNSFQITTAKLYSVVMIKREDDCYWFAKFLLLFCFNMMTKLDPDTPEFAFVQY